MKDENKKWHLDVLAMHQNIMFETLVYPFHLTTDTVKEFTLLDDNNKESIAQGYLAVKEVNGQKIKYFIHEDFAAMLPIRILETQKYYLQDAHRVKTLISFVKEAKEFKVNPEQCFNSIHEFIDTIAPFEHSNPEQWTLNKITAIAAYIGKTFIGISSEPEFGKSSIYEIINSITKKSPVFQPRSIPGIMIQITGDGNMVFDEVHKSTTEVKMCMENFTLQVAGGKPTYVNGAVQGNHTKPYYNVSGQSITYLFNLYGNYKNPEEEFFDNIFSNNDAMDSRILKIKFTGKLTEKFDKEFNMLECAELNKLYYIKVAKQLLYLKQVKLNSAYKRRFVNNSIISLDMRKKIVYDEITWLIDAYCVNQEEYDKYIYILDNCIIDYQEMIGKKTIQRQSVLPSMTVKEEQVEEKMLDWDDKLLVWLPCNKCKDTPCNINEYNKPLCKKCW